MTGIYAQLLGLGLTFLEQFLDSLTKNNAPAEVIDAIQAAIVALQAHKADVMSGSQWEAQRG